MFPGRTPSNGYGLTETSSVTTMNGGTDYQRKPDSVGVPVPVCDVQVVDGDGRPLPTGEVGELWIKGPNVVKGYWNKPEATAATITDGWLHSGDVARIDDEGFVYIVDRAKDMIIRGGENVYCVEVEAALFEHPAVTDAAAIGIPHHVLGEEVGAVVHLAPGTSGQPRTSCVTFVAERIAAFKVPVRIWFREDPLPRNPNGKIHEARPEGRAARRRLTTRGFGGTRGSGSPPPVRTPSGARKPRVWPAVEFGRGTDRRRHPDGDGRRPRRQRRDRRAARPRGRRRRARS